MADSSDSVFQTKNGERDTSATMQRILNEMSNGTDPSAPPMPPPAQAGEPGQPSKPDAPAGTAKAGVNAPQHLSDLDTADKMSAFWGSFGPKVAKDVAYGATLEAPGQIVGGAFDFYRHAGQAVGEFGDFLNKHLPASMVGTPEEQALEAQNRAKIRELAGKGEFSSENVLGIGGAPTTTTGGIVRSISEFMAGYSQPLALLKAGKIPEFLASPGAAGISMFLGTDPNQPNLTSMIVKQYPGLQGPLAGSQRPPRCSRVRRHNRVSPRLPHLRTRRRSRRKASSMQWRESLRRVCRRYRWKWGRQLARARGWRAKALRPWV
jgi:hypothetical protein